MPRRANIHKVITNRARRIPAAIFGIAPIRAMDQRGTPPVSTFPDLEDASQPQNASIPRHNEINKELAKKICKDLEVPQPGA
jgi:hypothetical protein